MAGHKMEHKGQAPGPAHAGHMQMIEDYKKRFFVCLALTIPIILLSSTVQGFFGVSFTFPGADYLVFLLSTIIYFYGGYPFLKGIFEELKERRPGMMTLIAVAISVAYFYSAAVVLGLPGMVFFWELATLIDIMLLGHWLEMRSVMGASMALEELVKIMPSEAHMVHDGHVMDVKVEELKAGDKVQVKPGEKVPVDGVVMEGETSVNQAMLTGESQPVAKRAGDKVIGGSINGEGAMIVRVEKTGRDTYLSQVVELVRQAQESKSRTQDFGRQGSPCSGHRRPGRGRHHVDCVAHPRPDAGLRHRAHGDGHGHHLPPRPRPGRAPGRGRIDGAGGEIRPAHPGPERVRERPEPAGHSIRQDRHAY